jgi:hypothetical protein
MTQRTSTKRQLADTLSALLVATALVAPAPAVLAADNATTAATKEKETTKANPCGPARKNKKKAGSDNPCAPGNPCAPRKN